MTEENDGKDGKDEKESFRNEFAALAIVEGIEPRFADNYYDLIFELATGLVSRGDALLMIGVSGAQGTGKSTFAKMLAIVFERVFSKRTLVMSLDDFYLTRAEREALAAKVHPLLRTRGVPGTHDIGLLRKVIDDIRARRNTRVPVFSKAEDDRHEMVPVMAGELDLLIVEGWCWGALPSASRDLDTPINALEANRDPDGSWRRYVNQQLAEGGYQEVFAEPDVLFFMAAPDMNAVIDWRWQQEQRLAARQSGSAIMSQDQVRNFVMYYERITRQMLKDLPERATLTLYLDERHQLVPPPRRPSRGA